MVLYTVFITVCATVLVFVIIIVHSRLVIHSLKAVLPLEVE